VTYHYHRVRDSVSAIEFSQPVCTITAVSRSLFGGRLVFHMILVSPPYRTNWGCLFSRTPARSPGSYSTSCGTPSMFVLRSMRKHPRDLAEFSVNVIVNRSGKAIDTRRDEPSSKLLRGYRIAGLQPVPGGRNWAAIQPPPKRMTRPLRLAYSALEAVSVGNAGSRCGEPWTPGPSRRGPAQAFSSIAAMYPVLASATAPAISGALSTRPNVDGVAGRIQRSSYYHRVTPCGLSNRARRTPRFVAGVASATVANVGGRCIQATRDRCFRRAACAHTGAGSTCGPCGSSVSVLPERLRSAWPVAIYGR